MLSIGASLMAIAIDSVKLVDRPVIPIVEYRRKTNRLFRKRLVYDATIERAADSLVSACNTQAINNESAMIGLMMLNNGYLYSDDNYYLSTGRNDHIIYDFTMVRSRARYKQTASSLHAHGFLIECLYCKQHLPSHLSHYHKTWIWSGSDLSALKRAIAMYKAFAKPKKPACIYYRKPELITKRVEDYQNVYSGYID